MKEKEKLSLIKKKEKPPPDWTTAEMSPEAEACYRNEFLPHYTELIEQISKTPLTILVWGPGPSGGDLYEKRQQIRGELLAGGCAAKFSEEIDFDVRASSLSAKARELCQALAADFIVVIQSSPGSIAEVHDFADFIGYKMLIFIDERAKDGYSYTGALEEQKTLYNNVETYKYPKDIKECHLLGSVEKKVQMLQVTKWRELKKRAGR